MTGLAGFSGDALLTHAFGLLMLLARIGTTMAMMPGLGETAIPTAVKAGIILVLTLLLLPVIEPVLPPRPVTEVALALMIMIEMVNGLWFGWLARVLASSLPMAGQLIADFAGLSNVLMPSPESGAQATALARLYEVVVPVLILSTGLYRELLSALTGFYRLIPPGSIAWASDSATVTVTAIAGSFGLALRLATPFVLASVAWNVGIGLIARLVPRLQVFFVALPGQIGLGLLLLSSVAIPLITAWMEAMTADFGTLPGGG